MADRIVVLRDGRIEQIGTPLELYDSPANVFVAEFIGSPAMNMLPARLRQTATGARRSSTAAARSSCPPPSPAPTARRSCVGIRPEHLSVG